MNDLELNQQRHSDDFESISIFSSCFDSLMVVGLLTIIIPI